MKLKKLFAGIVAVAMMATMAIPGFAAKPTSGATSDVDNGGAVSIKLIYTGNGWATDATGLDVGTGKAYAMENTSLTGDAKTAAMGLAIRDVSTTTATEGAENKLEIKLPNYTNVGTYYYKVKQVASTANGMEHATDELVLMVHVINEDGEDLSKTGLKCKVAVLDADPLVEGTTPNKIDSLTNVYSNGNLTVKKTVKGNLGDRKQEFSFKVVLTKTAAITGNITLKVPNKEPITITPANWTDNTYTTEVFTMKHGESASFANLPYGVTVQAIEVDENGRSVDTNLGDYEVTNSGKTEEIKKNGATEIEIINRSTVNVNTGVILDNAPYIALLTIVAAGAVVMILKKRRNYED